MFRFFRKQFRRHAPTKEELQRSPLLKPLGKRIWASELWRFSRRSVPVAVAVGLFVGIVLMIPGLQIVGAALMAVPFRANIPIAAMMNRPESRAGAASENSQPNHSRTLALRPGNTLWPPKPIELPTK